MSILAVIIAGLVATLVMSMVMALAPKMGFPKMDIVGMLSTIAGDHTGRPIAVSGHAILFALFAAAVREERATETSKNRIGFGHYAIVESHSGFRIAPDFGP